MVSCQAYPGDPLDDTDAIRRMALAAVGAGASGLRLNSAEHIAAIRRHTGIPIIGIQKRYDAEGLRITPDFAAASALAAADASMIALDCTGREWLNGDPWREIIERVHRELQLPVMADVSTCEEALAAAADAFAETEREALQIYQRIDRELAVEEARADRLLQLYGL